MLESTIELKHADRPEQVAAIAKETIQKIYPGYYPSGAVQFFLDLHSKAGIEEAMCSEEIYLVTVREKIIGTGSIRKNKICRLFILPEYQGKGYGSSLMDLLETKIFENYSRVHVDASFPAESMYLKRGYQITSYEKIETENGDFLCYHTMEKKLDVRINESIEKTRNGFEESFLEGKFYERQTRDDSHLHLLLKEIRGEGTAHILDLGTGTGYLAFSMAEQYPECQVYGLDIVNETILRNQKKASALKNCHFISYDGRKFPFQDCFFDRVVSRYAMHHFPAVEETFQEIGRVLKPGGLLLVSDPVPNLEDEKRFIDRFMKMKPDGHIRFYSEEEFVRLAQKAGFRKKKSIGTSITFPRKQAELYRKLIQNTPKAVLDGYHIKTRNNEIWITEKVVNLVFEKM